MRYLTAAEIVAIHDRIIEQVGGVYGMRDIDVLEYASTRPATVLGNKEMFGTVFEKAACYMDSIAARHPFADGNKRTSVAVASVFLRANGITVDLQDINAIESFVLHVAQKQIELHDIASWLQAHSRSV